MGYFKVDLKDGVRPGGVKVDVVRSKFPSGLAFLVKLKRIFFFSYFDLLEILYKDSADLVFQHFEVNWRVLVTQQVDYIFVIDFEVTYCHFC